MRFLLKEKIMQTISINELEKKLLNSGFEVTKEEILNNIKNDIGYYILLNEDMNKIQIFEYKKLNNNKFVLKIQK